VSLAIIHSRALAGVNAPLITIEAHLSKGIPGFSIVGLPEKAVKESKDRVRSALINSGFKFPTKRITVNLAPADLPKEGGRFDLPIALGILAASEQLPKEIFQHYEIAGELELSGRLRSIKGVLPFAVATSQQGKQLIVPLKNADEAALSEDLSVYAAEHILDVCSHLNDKTRLSEHVREKSITASVKYPDLSDVKGQAHARRALEVAAAGGHSLLFVGPPGTGKTMLSSRLPGILPPMTKAECLEVAALYSVSKRGFDAKHWGVRPFRSPHHTASSVALVGGGSPPRPGEISLAHAGVLFLDELPEYQRQVLEALREPLEAGVVTISRAANQAQFPARFQLIVAMNPCPCGYYTDPNSDCRCTDEQISRYQARISGPLMDRIDMHVEVPPLPKGVLLDAAQSDSEPSDVVRSRVVAVRDRQLSRSKKSNAMLSSSEVLTHCCLSQSDRHFFENTVEKFGLSARAYHRLLRLARTIADMAQSEKIKRQHLQEAFAYRSIACHRR